MSKILYTLFLCLSISMTLFAQEETVLTCKDFKEGTFIVPGNERFPDTFIIRNGNQQTEILEINGKREESVIDLIWVSDCVYTMTFNKEVEDTSLPKSEEVMNMVITITMKSIEGNCAYFEAVGSGRAKDFVVPGTICKEETL
ncbi:hypothetical protein [uncultured Dokdonia sp.]|uniref:hypothetical protein n=1 Tax=uncultured Dokdonia sp. TaxID=575653 RepID=UPI0026300307|nr:hypothetical protein [uncultured Dokdonia sp.]